MAIYSNVQRCSCAKGTLPTNNLLETGMRTFPVCCAAIATIAQPVGIAMAQNTRWPVGAHAQVYYPLPGGRGMAWRSGVVTESFPWGVHFHFDDEDRIESFTYDLLKPLGAAPKTTAQPRPSPPPGAGSGSRLGNGYATTGKGDYRAGYGAGVKFGTQPPATTSAKRLVPNSYNCTAFIGTPPNGYLSKTGGFAISGTNYRYQDGTRGTVSISGGVLEFHGGALDGQAATYDAGATGRGTIHIYNASRSRTVIDCDGG